MDVLKNLQTHIKSKIQFKTSDGVYEGIVKLACPVTRKIIIEDLTFISKHLFIGVMNFHIDEILSYKIISQDQITALSKTIEITSSINLPKEKDFILKLPQHSNLKLPTHSVVLDCIDEEFFQAIALIQKEDSIGMSLDGPSIGRDGLLSWISISTPYCTFLFDIQNLKEKAFKAEGMLKGIFENPKIEKIIHDCRNASDCLYHKFNTKIINVFDTQVAELLVALQISHKGTIPHNVNSLNFCLHKYLNIPIEFLPKPKQRSYIEDIINYQLRPLLNETRDLLIKNVVYLRALKCKLHRLLLNPFYRAVDVYLKVVQSASDRELLLEPPSKDEIPHQLIIDGIQTIRFRDPISATPIPTSETSVANITANYTNMCKSNKYNVRNSNRDDCGSPSNMEYTSQFDFVTEFAAKFDQTRNADSLNPTVLKRPSENTNSEHNKNRFTESKSMNGVQVINSESLDKNMDMTNKERFRLSRRKFHSNLKPLVDLEKLKTSDLEKDPYAKLREAFASGDEVDGDETKKPTFIPAGMT